MKVNPSQETAVSLLSGVISRDKFEASFQASLDRAKANMSESRTQQASESTATQGPLDAARKDLEEYIRKGPIAHMREKILEQMGLSEEDLAKMTPEQRETVEKTIAARIKEMLLAGSGIDPKTVRAQLLDTSLSAAAAKALLQSS